MMQSVSVLIVGHGIAGMCLSFKLTQNKIPHLVFDPNTTNASKIAAGVYNPVVLKRFNLIWKALEMQTISKQFFTDFEAFHNIHIDKVLPVLRLFANEHEVNTWKKKCSNPSLTPFLNPNPISNPYDCIEAKYGFGEVHATGRINITKALETQQEFLENQRSFIKEVFDYSELSFDGDWVQYKEFKAKHIVFCEGMGSLNNPFFKEVEVIGNKGQTIEVQIPHLSLNHILKSSIFLLPLQQNVFKVGATYERIFESDTPTPKGIENLSHSLGKFLKAPFKILETSAGIRPTTSNRRPIIGRQPKHKNIWILNGMGTRGVLLAPWSAQQLIHAIFEERRINPEVDVARYYS